MATNPDFIEFVVDQLRSVGDISYKKMFGEYMIYIGIKPAILVCDNTVFVKQIPEVAATFDKHGITPDAGFPYNGAREHYILDIENGDLATDIVRVLERALPVPKPKKPKAKK